LATSGTIGQEPKPQALRLESRLESPLAAKILVILETSPLGNAALAEKLGHKTVSGELNKQVRRLVAKGLLEPTLPDKPTSRLQQYRLSKAGRHLFQEIASQTI